MSGNETKSNLAHMASAHLQDRREVRFAISIEIEVSGIDVEGRVFHERTFTVVRVSREGDGWLVGAWKMNDDDGTYLGHSAHPWLMRSKTI